MKKKTIFKVLLPISVILIIALTYIFLVQKQEYDWYYKPGAILIDQIEKFKQREGRLPNDIGELGEKENMGRGPYYEKKDSVNYTVYFNIGFDHESKIYYSDRKEWMHIGD